MLNRAHSLCNDAFWRLLGPTTVLPSGLPVQLRSESDWVVYNEIFVSVDYDQAILEAFRSRPEAHDVRILDLGANVGFFTLRCVDLARQNVPAVRLKIIAVEGAPSVFSEFSSRIAPLQEEGVAIIPLLGLVGRRAGTAKIYSSTFAAGNSVAPPGSPTSALPLFNRYAVESSYVDLETLIAPDEFIDLLKCDIEGSELLFLETYPNLVRRTHRLVIEIHAGACDADACHRLIESCGLEHRRTIRTQPGTYLEYFSREEGGRLAC